MIKCSPLPEFDATNWVQIDQAFSKMTPLELKQFWLPQPEPHFALTEVRLGWHTDALYVFATLQDIDIHSESTHDGQPMWQMGDVFEIFLRALPRVPWYEFHVTPNNHHLELCWPGDTRASLKKEKQRGYKAFIVSEPIIKSSVRICKDQQRWQVLTEIPVQLISAEKSIITGQEWLVSFCRYDAFQDGRSSVLSSTSDFTEPSFSHQHEWRRLRFVE